MIFNGHFEKCDYFEGELEFNSVNLFARRETKVRNSNIKC